MSDVKQEVEQIFRTEGTRVLATLIRLVGDFDLAEDCMQAAFVSALEKWPVDGVPGNPRAWLISTARFKAIDTLRRKSKFSASLDEHANLPEPAPTFDDSAIDDDHLRLIFTCCHPMLTNEAQMALTLREVCGLTTEEVASAFLTSPTTIGQRIVRAKARIRDKQIPYEIPDAHELPSRLRNVLTVAYLLFNEGYYASAGETLSRHPLSQEAIRLVRLLAKLIPEPEVFGLLSLTLLQESRRRARATEQGDVIVFDDQDTSLWDQPLFSEGTAALSRALEAPIPGEYALQASIAACHMERARFGMKNWEQVVALYDQLLAQKPSPIIELNRAVALGMVAGPEAGLAIVDLLIRGSLRNHGLAHATRADFCRRLGRLSEAAEAYGKALALSTQGAEQRFLENRLAEVTAP